MRRKYKTIQNKDENKTEEQKRELLKNNNNTEDLKTNFTKVSKINVNTSNKKNLIPLNPRESIKAKRYLFNKREENNNKNENKSEINKSHGKINTENKKENNKTVNNNTNNNNNNNNESKKYKFEKKKKFVPELNGIYFYRYTKTKNSLNNTQTDKDKKLNTDSNINEKSNKKKEKEKEKEDIIDNIRKKYSKKGFEKKSKIGKNKNNCMNDENQNNEKIEKVKKEEKEGEEKKVEKEEKEEKKEKEEGDDEKKIKIQTFDVSRQISNIPSDSNRTMDKTKPEKKIINSRNNKDANNISSLIKKFNNKPIYNSSLMSNINKIKKLFYENKGRNLNNDLKIKDNRTQCYTDKKDSFIELNSTTNSRNRMKRTFNFLIHQAHENSEISNTFNKMYEHYNSKKKNINKCFTIEQRDNSENAISANDNNNSSLNSISNLIKEFGQEKFQKKKCFKITIPLNEGKIEKKTIKKTNLRNLLDITPAKKSYNINTNITKDNDLKKGQSFNITNKIVNNNTFNTTYNIYKINNTISKKDFHSNIKEKTIILPDVNQQSIENANNNRKFYKIFINNKIDVKKEEKSRKIRSNSHQRVGMYLNKPSLNYQEIIINQQIINTNSINIEIIYLLESKIKSILYKINNYDICFNECQDWIFYYFNNNIYDLIINIFKNQRNKNNMRNKIKTEILCYFLCYDASFSKTFSQAGILLKTIFQLLYNNFLLIIAYIINNFTTINDKNDMFTNTLINNLTQIVNKELRLNLSMQEIHNENCITEIIEQNFKQISNYYKMIIDNLYNYSNTQSCVTIYNNNEDNMNNKIYKFPQCLSLDLDKLNDTHKIKIISMFFFDAYKLLDNYNILDLNIFYDLYLKNHNNKDDILNNNKNKKKTITIHRNKYMNDYYKSLRNNYKSNNSSKYFLSQIKPYYKCSLLINLDILVYDNNFSNLRHDNNDNIDNNNKIIIRPGLFQFLQEMKQIYELILFCDNSFEYLIKIIDILDRKEKIFEYILSNEQISFDKNGSIKNIESLGRNLKNIIILDKNQTFFKLNNDNIIYVKPFYGGINNDGNILNNLTDVLKKIKYDMEDIDDVRIPISNHKAEIFTKISTNLF